MRLPPFRPLHLLAALLLATPLLQGCATPPPADDKEAMEEFRQTNDPAEPTNRAIYAVNNALDVMILEPAARAYRGLTPAPVRSSVHNILSNLGSPVRLAADMAQGKPRLAGDTLMRMVINTTVGLGGVFDVATDWGYPHHDNGAGTTLAVWGMEEGPYLVLPIFGPSNPRDTGGFLTDMALDPFTYTSGPSWSIFSYSRIGATALDERERHIDDVDQIRKQALDSYATFRSLYRQHRAAEIARARMGDKSWTKPAWFAPSR